MENNTHLKRWQNLWRFQYQMGIRVSMQQFHIERISSSSDILGVWLQRCRTQKHGHRNYQLEYRGREKYMTNCKRGIGIFEWNLNENQCHDYEWWNVTTCPVFLAKDLLHLYFIIDIGLSLSVHGTLLPIYLEPDLHLRDALAHERGFQG